MSEIPKSTFLEESEPGIPDSTPPTLDQLSQRLNRRRARKRTRLALGGSLAVIGLVATAALQRGSEQSPATTDSRRDYSGTASQSSSSSDVPIHELRDIRLLASVYQSVPLFEIEADTRRCLHVGWIESEEVLPIDLGEVTDDQQATLRAVLSDDDERKYIYL